MKTGQPAALTGPTRHALHARTQAMPCHAMNTEMRMQKFPDHREITGACFFSRECCAGSAVLAVKQRVISEFSDCEKLASPEWRETQTEDRRSLIIREITGRWFFT
jgi:hypothetical protein